MLTRPRRREQSVARQVLVLQLIAVLVLVVTALALATYDARNDIRASARDEAISVATAVARSPIVQEARETPDPAALLQPFAESVRVDTGVDFVVIMDRDRTRWSHPNPVQLGKTFIGNLGGALEGEVYTEEYVGTLGPSIRAIVPVFASTGGTDPPVVALVAVGITLTQLDDLLVDEFADIVVAAVAVLVVGVVGAWLISQRLRRQTHGMGEREITRMYEYYSAVLHAVREGLLLIDLEGRVQLVNDEARRLLGLPDDVVGRSLDDLGLPPALVAAAAGDKGADEVYVTGDHVLVASSSAAFWDGKEVGAVVTLRDHTELQAVTGELDTVRGLTESLRAQTHEAANRLHTVVSLIEMGRPDDAVDFVTDELKVAQMLTDRVVAAVGDPVVAALLLGKSAEAAERGISLTVTGELPGSFDLASPRDLVTVLGNLVDNAIDAVAGSAEKRIEVHLEGSPTHARVVVGDSGPGLTADEATHALERGWTTKVDAADGHGLGLALVSQVARRLGGGVTIGRSALGGAELVVVLGEQPGGESR
ncbi:histidine kinase [Nocardioides flavus (ex Wang et al. 2016)]|uniref:histidine kinase n=1 Tax=Nocardioides flavus (ex Wang et al. 2016) TaxID=2058780 RepID=A0ABQ3HFR8_9ACTN|nr:sensor histidine kinase [Nocardioides flavus (ex Wang et al. 2016)]GHE15656.1 histidine kinase [Nocardioides flavus (ex Wang et al. 2016)]